MLNESVVKLLKDGRVPPLYEDYSQKKKGSQYATG